METAEEAAHVLGALGDRLARFGEAFPAALAGEWRAVVALVDFWRSLVIDILEAATVELPELVKKVGDGVMVRTADGTFSHEPVQFLESLVSDAPFAPAVTVFGPDIGTGVEAVSAVRGLLPGLHPLAVGPSPGWPNLGRRVDQARYRRLVGQALRSVAPPIARAKELYGLNTTQLADLFGVTRQAIAQWDVDGVPPARREKLANLLAVGELLERKLRSGRLPLIAQRPSSDYGGLSMLEMAAAGRDRELRDLTERAFDWSATA